MALPVVTPPRLLSAVAAVVAFVPPLAMGSVPVTPVVNGKPVAFVNVPEVGVPRMGVTSVGLVARTTLPVPVVANSPTTPELSYKIRPVVPPVIVVVPTVKPLAPEAAAQEGTPAASVRTYPFVPAVNLERVLDADA
jgi:hypothetical protein